MKGHQKRKHMNIFRHVDNGSVHSRTGSIYDPPMRRVLSLIICLGQVFLATALLRYISHTISSPIQSTIQFNSFQYIHRVAHLSQQSILEHFHHPQRNPVPLSYHLLILHLHLQPQAITNFCLCRYDDFGCFIQIKSCNMWSFMTSFFHLAQCFRGSSLQHESVLHSL